MDEKDKILLNELGKDSKRSVQELSKATKIPSTTVYNRIKDLEKEGIIKHYTVKLDNKKVGKIQAFFEISVNPSVNVSEFLKKIKADEIYSVAGDYQFLIKSTFNDLGGVYSFTAQLQQAKADKVKTTIVLDEL
ncbi:Lrp/AsnC family transcriptional regulator [Candidatus Woesearchaeota archaeon]|nr:Lrp/AsnC family transcriptional regulator [Candidatus Woesearchaeota archaeon]